LSQSDVIAIFRRSGLKSSLFAGTTASMRCCEQAVTALPPSAIFDPLADIGHLSHCSAVLVSLIAAGTVSSGVMPSSDQQIGALPSPDRTHPRSRRGRGASRSRA
jgi:hypothetical protein